MTDYTIYYKDTLSINEDWSKLYVWDLFISAYNSSERVTRVFDKVISPLKYWLLFSEYAYKPEEYPEGNKYVSGNADEAEFITSFYNSMSVDLSKSKVCVDITGFIRPYLITLIKWFRDIGLSRFDILYSEPGLYTHKDETKFSDERDAKVRQVKGFEGIHNLSDTSNDIMIIGPGYETRLIVEAANYKENAKKIQIFGLPSLQADMYQENVIKAHDALEDLGIGASGEEPNNFYAPAYDPFVYAQVLHDIVTNINSMEKITNLYLCPLATKPQVLGFTLYYLQEWVNKEASIIFPFCRTYSPKTSKGISRVWKYSVELG